MVVQIFSQHQKIILSSSYTELKLILEASNEISVKNYFQAQFTCFKTLIRFSACIQNIYRTQNHDVAK